MKQEDVIAFIYALNCMQKYVPPIVFGEIAQSAVSGQLAQIANGAVVCTLSPHPDLKQAHEPDDVKKDTIEGRIGGL